MRVQVANSRQLRKNQTEAEKKLWYRLRYRQLDGIKFRRQFLIAPYIVDFVSVEKKLIVELDGGQHAEQSDYDATRDAFLAAQGFTVLRFWNNEVMQNMDGVLKVILQHVASG